MLNKKILIASRFFPPIGGSGVQRLVKTIKYMTRASWKIHVVTTKRESNAWPQDKSLLAPVKKAIIHRPFTLEPELERKLLNKILSIFLVYGIRILWFPWIIKKSLKVIKKESIKLAYVTGPPFSNLVLGYLLKKFLKIKLITEFRDAWNFDPYQNKKIHFFWRKSVNKILEKKVIKISDRVIFVTRGTKNIYSDHYKYLTNVKKFCVNYNGYDPEDFNRNYLKYRNNVFTITYVGMFFPFRKPDIFLKALAEVISEDNRIKDKIIVRFIGKFFEEKVKQETKKLISSLKLQNNVKLINYVTHDESVGFLIKSDVNLFITGKKKGGEFVVAGKTFEYLAARKPILALTYKDGEAARMFIKSQFGVVVDQEDIKGIKAAILKLYNNWQNNSQIDVNETYIQSFNKLSLVQDFIKICNETLRDNKRK